MSTLQEFRFSLGDSNYVATVYAKTLAEAREFLAHAAVHENNDNILGALLMEEVITGYEYDEVNEEGFSPETDTRIREYISHAGVTIGPLILEGLARVKYEEE